MLPLSAQLKDFWFRRLASLQDQKFISKTVATVDNLCMVDHVKFVIHFKDFMACCNIIIGGLMDGSLCKILGPGPAGPKIDVHPTSFVARTEHRHVRQDSLFSATVQLPVNVRCLRDSLSVTGSGSHSGNPLKLLL